MEALAIPGSENAKGCFAQPRCLFQYCVEHRGQIAGRGVDDLQNLGGCGLLSQRFVALGCSLSKLGSAFGKLTFEIGCTLLGIG
jgi:hypothetical protein